MTTGRRRAVVLAAVALLLGACSTQRQAATGRSSQDGLSSASPSAQASAPGAVVSSASPRAQETGRAPTSNSPGSASQGNGLVIEVVIRECLERGRPASAVIRTVPGTMLVASATYSDGQSYYNYWVGVADARGEYPVAWTPPLEAPLGKGKFLVGAQSDDGGNTAVKEFRLAKIGSCS